MEHKFTSENFINEVINSDIPVLVDFYADWCGPCQMMMPIVEEMAEKYEGKIKIGKVNTDMQSGLASQYGIVSIPTFLFFKKGQIIDVVTGVISRDRLVKMLDSLV